MAATTRQYSVAISLNWIKTVADPRFRDHIAELKNTKPKQPFFFLKPPSSIVLPGEGACLRPKGIEMHFEVELALIMGKVVRDLKADDTQGALDAIQGESPPVFTATATATAAADDGYL